MKQARLKRNIWLNSSPFTAKSSPLKKSGRIKVKPVSEEQKQARNEQREKDMEHYARIWHERGPYSEISGEYLGAEVNIACCDHLLEKSKYSHLRYVDDNMILVTIQEHAQKTAGYPHPKYQEAIDRVKAKYNL